MPFLELENVNLFVSGKPILIDAELRVNPGDRIGIVGRNGCGKSQLMDLLAGNSSPDAGDRKLAKDTTVLLVKQQLPEDDLSPIEYLRENDPDLNALQIIMDEDLSDISFNAKRFADACDRHSELDTERYEILAPMVLRGLGLVDKQLAEPMRNLSGGMRMRVSFAMALIRTPEILLLDEPTNHLDLEATRWLTQYLSCYPAKCAVVIVTHDKALLMEACTSTVHLRGGKLTVFGGDYESYLGGIETKDRKDAERNTVLAKQAAQKEEQYYKQRGIPSRGAHAVQQHKKAQELKKEMVIPIVEEPIVALSFGEPAKLPDPIIKLEGVSIGYKGKPVLSNVSVSVQSGEKIGLLGRNGEGKTTLLRLLADELGQFAPIKGDIVKSARLKIGYFSQELSDQLNDHLTVYAQFQASTGIVIDKDIRETLGRYGFSHDKVLTLVEHLSGGEKSRLLFALICARSPNVIIFDEPTNHLDVETRAVLVEAIRNFPGSVILVSHDFALQMETMSQFWLVKGGAVQTYDRGLAHYQKTLEKFIAMNLPMSTAGEKASTPAPACVAAGGASGGRKEHFFKPAEISAKETKGKKSVDQDVKEPLSAVRRK